MSQAGLHFGLALHRPERLTRSPSALKFSIVFVHVLWATHVIGQCWSTVTQVVGTVHNGTLSVLFLYFPCCVLTLSHVHWHACYTFDLPFLL
jgi:hypothetical protein